MFFKAHLYSETANTTALLFTFAMLVFLKSKLQTGSELGASCPRVRSTSRSMEEGMGASSWKHRSSSEV